MISNDFARFFGSGVLTLSYRMRTSLLLMALVLGAGMSALAQNYTIDWYTVDGGGGTSTGGVFTVSGTIGQPDAGTMTGGNFSLQGGFWGIVSAVQTPGSPLLSVTLTATNTVLVSWPSPSTGFNLQINNDLNTANWSPASQSITDNGTIKYVIVSPPGGNLFFRLKQ
jgi:hypothetical protein